MKSATLFDKNQSCKNMGLVSGRIPPQLAYDADLCDDRVGLGSDFDVCIVPKLNGDVTGVPNLIAALGEHGYNGFLLANFVRHS